MWKALKEYLRKKGIECNSPLSCFKQAFKEGLINENDEELFGKLIEIRNLLIHIYDEETAEKLYRQINKKNIFEAINNLIKNMKS